jgi:hypothetical protein
LSRPGPPREEAGGSAGEALAEWQRGQAPVKRVNRSALAVQPDLDRFVALVRRELDAHEVSVHEPVEAPEATGDGRELRCATPDGRIVVARWLEPPVDRDAKQTRLEMLASAFDAVADEAAHPPSSRPPASLSLRVELQALCDRAAAINALVIDANSPILWGAAWGRDIVPKAWAASPPPPEAEGAPSGTDARLAEVSRHALQAVRGLVELSGIRKGKRVRHVERDGAAPFLVHSCAGIYLLTLVFAASFDELRAERAVLESLLRIERLVLALPPLDPDPPRKGAGVISMRRPRRR